MSPPAPPASCPVDHSSSTPPPSTRPPISCPIDHTKASTPQPQPDPTNNPLAGLSADSCPYSAERQEQELIAESNKMPPPSQLPAQDQKQALSTEREHSTIPMAGRFEGKHWVYPSEQMFFNAMRRKNWQPSEQDMSVVVPIHNAVNEQCWHKILEWEALYKSSCGQPKLLKFQGKPKDYTPKACIRSLLGYTLPFDRHDWTIDRCGKTVTYVIDFYSGAPAKDGGVSFYLDVRPKLTVNGVMDRLRMWWSTGSGLW
ncbi:holocytochrome-c synthase [Spizellomyces sp. 'palustris']|nr:holocytochrome-c synthase [Spizellomyces sp. 'palustris']TPX63469.1 holocytochrome-c synthase [Spizellomyces sp. 'palustris']